MVFNTNPLNSEIFKLSLYLSFTRLRAQIACCELKGNLSPVMLKEIFHESRKFPGFMFFFSYTLKTVRLQHAFRLSHKLPINS